MAALNDHSLDKRSSLSAMYDGEATERDIECLINADSGELSRQLESFHLIQQTLHNNSDVAIKLEDSLVLSIRAQIEAEDSASESLEPHNATDESLFNTNDDKSSIQVINDEKLIPFVRPAEKPHETISRSSWKMMFSSVAVAASVTFVVVLGGNVFLTPETDPSTLTAHIQSPVGTQSPELSTAVASLVELKKEGLQIDNVRLQKYLRQHAEQASITVGQGMIPMARVVSYPVKE